MTIFGWAACFAFGLFVVFVAVDLSLREIRE